MTQVQWLLLLLKIVLVAGAVANLAFIAQYTRLTKWGCWHDRLGRTIVLESALLVLVFIPSLLSVFLQFSRLNSEVAAWIQLVFLSMVPAVMLWRIVVFQKERSR